jgi:hypothetical protein
MATNWSLAGTATSESLVYVPTPGTTSGTASLVNDGNTGTYHGGVASNFAAASSVTMIDYVTFVGSHSVSTVTATWLYGWSATAGGGTFTCDCYLYYSGGWQNIGSLGGTINTVITSVINGSWTNVTGIRMQVYTLKAGPMTNTSSVRIYELAAEGTDPPTTQILKYMGVPQASILTALNEPIASVKNLMGVANN